MKNAIDNSKKGATQPAIELKNVYKSFHSSDSIIEILKDENLKIEQGEFVVIVGPSGSGKSTLLSLIGGLDLPDKGSIIVKGNELTTMTQKQLRNYRKNNIGFIFQFYSLIPTLTALENIEIILELTHLDKRFGFKMLEAVNLQDRADHYPGQLSGGEKQRVAIARALAKQPKILLCDEPTGQLDSQTGEAIMNIISIICKQKNLTTLLVTHDRSLRKFGDRIIEIKDGSLREISVNL